MKTETIKLFVSDAAGSVSAEYILPAKSKCILTLAHGAGAGMQHPFMIALANKLAEKNIATLRFNFPSLKEREGRMFLLLHIKQFRQRYMMPIKNFLRFLFLYQVNHSADE